MERVRRRYWTWAVTLFAGLVILAAAVSGLFQLAVLALPSYREELASWVTRVAGRPVEIGGIGLVWRGLSPSIDLQDITLYDDDEQEAVTAERISLGFSKTRLLFGELTPTRIELSGLNLAADIDEEGRLSVAGFETGGAQDFPKRDRLLKELSRFRQVRLSNCQVRFTHAGLGRTPMPFTLVSGEIDRTHAGFDVEAEIHLPPEFGEEAELSASIDGDVADPRSWDGDFEGTLSGVAPQGWLASLLLSGTQLRATGMDLEIAGALRSGRLARAQAQLQADAMVIARGGRAHQVKDMEIDSTLATDGRGWRLELGRFELDGEPQLRGGLRYERLAPDSYELDFDFDELLLDRLTPWLAYLRAAPLALRRAAPLHGRVEGAVLRLQRAGESLHYSLRADLQGLGLQGDPALGFQGFNGAISATEAGGRLQLAGTPLKLRLPRVMAAELPFDAVNGELHWARSAAGWSLEAPTLTWKLGHARGNGSLQLDLPTDRAQSPQIDLAMALSADDVTALKPYMPLHWGAPLKDWLSRAVVAGRVPRGALSIRGPLADFPFHQRRSGEWKLDLDVAGGRLAFSPDWPAVDKLAAHLAFRGNSLSITSDAASLSGNHVERVRAEIADFHEGRLRIDGRIAGEAARFYDLLRNSPLRQRLAALVNRTRASGPARVELQLDIPLHEVKDTAASGTVALDGVQLFYEGLDVPVDDIRGSLRFSGRGVEAERLDARFSEIKLAARIEPRPRTAGVIVAEFAYAPQPSGGVSEFIPSFVRSRLSGESRWRAELPMDAPDAALTLSSELRGTVVQLPPPLGKTAAEALPIRLALGGDAAAPVRVRLDYAQRLGADIALARDGQSLKVRTVNLRLGGGMPAASEQRGILVSGELPEIDIGLWAALLAGDKSGSDGLSLSTADVSAGRWLFDDRSIGAARMRWQPSTEGWRAELSGSGAEGELRYARAGGGALSARLKHLRLLARAPSPPASTSAATPAPPPAETQARDPSRWPTLDIDCDQLAADGTELGHLLLRSTRIAEGQRIETMTMKGGKLDLDASGSWRRSDSRSSAELKFALASSDVGAVLQSLGYTPTLSARSSRFNGELSWTAAPQLDWQRASGRVQLEVDSGTLKAVEPGTGGRVLGLLNLYAIPRRLLLDFRDVVNAGLGFDQLSGTFMLGDGIARTEDMEIRSTAVRMEIRGRIGLVARDFDQTVKVYPDVSSGVTLGAALLGGPAVGALVLLAQQLLDKPIEQATQLGYRVTGSWDNPRVERTSGN